MLGTIPTVPFSLFVVFKSSKLSNPKSNDSILLTPISLKILKGLVPLEKIKLHLLSEIEVIFL